MKKVLIIDDENKTKEFIKRLLISFGHNFDIYTDGSNVESGINAINKIKPDLVFLDIQMPDGKIEVNQLKRRMQAKLRDEIEYIMGNASSGLQAFLQQMMHQYQIENIVIIIIN